MKKDISAVAKHFVKKKFAQFRKEAGRGSGLYYELYAQNFTYSVERLCGATKRADLRAYIDSEARKDCDYVPPETGRWTYDHDREDVRFSKPDAPNPVGGQRGRSAVEALLDRATTPSKRAQEARPFRHPGIDR